MWVWASRKPRTRAVGEFPRSGGPDALTCTSGKAGQPVAGTSAQRASVAADVPSRPLAVTERPFPFEQLVKPRRSSRVVTFQSAVGPGVLVADTPSGSTRGISPP